MIAPNMLQATWNDMLVVPPRGPTLKFIEKVIYSKKKKLLLSLCNGATHKCV
jgi:hypothetical protein